MFALSNKTGEPDVDPAAYLPGAPNNAHISTLLSLAGEQIRVKREYVCCLQDSKRS